MYLSANNNPLKADKYKNMSLLVCFPHQQKEFSLPSPLGRGRGWGFPYFPNIFFISFSLFSASTGVRLLMSSPIISSRICASTGSSSWKKDSCMPS